MIGLKPREFMLMNNRDYELMQEGYMMRFNMESGIIRRQTYLIVDLIARAAGNKSGYGINNFDAAWPLDVKTKVDIKEVLEKKKAIQRKELIKLSNDVHLQEALKKLKRGGSGNKGRNRGGRK
jgi:hypothetical protein